MLGQDGFTSYLADIPLPVTFIVFALLSLFLPHLYILYISFIIYLYKRKRDFFGGLILSLYSQGMYLIQLVTSNGFLVLGCVLTLIAGYIGRNLSIYL